MNCSLYIDSMLSPGLNVEDGNVSVKELVSKGLIFFSLSRG